MATWAELAEVVQALVALVGVPILIWQMRQVRKSLYSDALSSVYSGYLDLDRYFIQAPALRRVFYDKLPPEQLEAHDRDRLDAVCELVMDVLYQSYLQRELIERFSAEQAFIERLTKASVIRPFLQKNHEHYDCAFLREIGYGDLCKGTPGAHAQQPA